MSRFKLAWFTPFCLTLIFTFTETGFSQDEGHPNRDGRGFPDLVGGLKAIEGCIGVETAQTPDGKQCIFAWFENKKAVLNWYNSDMHQGVQEAFFPDEQEYTPLKDIPDDLGPIMVIASITFSDKENFEATNLPISQIAIELYTPVSGGLFLGSKFAPDAVKVKNMKDYTPKGKTE